MLSIQIKQDITNWAKYLGLPQKDLGGMPVCPFAMSNLDQYIIQVVDTEQSIIPNNFELCIYVINFEVSIESINELCIRLNKNYPDFISLPNHKDRDTYINGIQTNNKNYNLILCQSKEKLIAARQMLYKTNYYSYWDKDYLKEILGDNYVDLD